MEAQLFKSWIRLTFNLWVKAIYVKNFGDKPFEEKSIIYFYLLKYNFWPAPHREASLVN